MTSLRFLQAVVLLSSLQTGAVSAATYWVSKEGSDANPCFASSGRPSDLARQTRLTITRGATCLSSGDTLLVLPGNYNEYLNSPLPNNATLRSADSNRANWFVLKPQNNVIPNRGNALNLLSARSNITLRFIKVDMSDITAGNFPSTCMRVGTSTQAVSVTIEDFECIGPAPGMVDWSGAGINIGPISTAVVRRGLIKNFISTNTGPEQPGAHGFYWRGNNSLVENVTIDNIDGRCVRAGAVTDNIFRYNICKNAVKGFGGSWSSGGNNFFTHNNLFWNTSRVEIGGSGQKFVNNTIYGTRRYHCIRIQGSAHSVRNNIFLDCGSNPAILNESSGSMLSHNLVTGTASSIFTDHQRGDFSLKSGSPAIDAGISVSGVLCNGTCDQGAYEYGLKLSSPSDSDLQAVPADPANLAVTPR